MEGRGRDKVRLFSPGRRWAERVDIEVLGWLLVVMELVRAARDDFVRLALAVGHRRRDAVAAAPLTVGQLVPQANSADIAMDGLGNCLYWTTMGAMCCFMKRKGASEGAGSATINTAMVASGEKDDGHVLRAPLGQVPHARPPSRRKVQSLNSSLRLTQQY